jgi:hypothetical protein
MPSFKAHCEQAELTFGRPFEEVHLWLDEFAGKPPFGMKHRHLRHHLQGVEEVRRMWGDTAADAAKQHIEADLAMEGWTPRDQFPRSSEHYRALGLL